MRWPTQTPRIRARPASGGHDNTVRVWRTDTWQSQGGLADHTHWVSTVAFSPDGRLLGSSSLDSTVRVWDLPSQRYIRIFNEFADWWVVDFAFSPDSHRIAAINNEPTLFVFDISSGDLIAMQSLPYGTVSISWSPDGQHIATSGYETNLWAFAG